MVIAAICDKIQATGAYLALLGTDQLDLVIQTGKSNFDSLSPTESLTKLVKQTNQDQREFFQWGKDYVIPLFIYSKEEDGPQELSGIIGVSGLSSMTIDEEQMEDLMKLVDRIEMALAEHRLQQEIFLTLQEISPQISVIQQMRAASRFDRTTLLDNQPPPPPQDIAKWVKDALTHYWGGPKLTNNPLLSLQIVKDHMQASNEANDTNALRSILKEGIENIKPPGEQRFTGEWLLYNILEMKFLQGRKVRDVALRLAMSEADLYRKQRVAIEALAQAIHEKEMLAQQKVNGNGSSLSVQST